MAIKFSISTVKKILHIPEEVPRFVQISLTNSCNLSCKMCIRNYIDVDKRHMRWEDFTIIVDKLKGVRQISLGGMGESLTHPRFFDAVRYCKARGFKVQLTSNALLLNREGVLEKIIKSGLDSISFSIESLGDDHEIGHANSESARNIEALIAKKKEVGSKTPKVVLQPILFKDTLKDLYDIIKWGAKIGVDRVNVVRVDLRFVPDMKRPSVEEEREIFKEFARLRKEYKIRIDCLQDRIFDGAAGFIYKHAKRLLDLDNWCYRFQDFIYVNVNGNVHPCCLSEEQVMGNLLKQGLKEIWHGERFNYIRRHQGEFSYCKRCDFLRLKQISALRRKALLINPRKGWRPALGLLYIASYLRGAGYEVKVIEFIDESFFPAKNERLWKQFYDYDPDFIGLGVISWNRLVAKKIIEKIRSSTKGKVIVCGGKDPTFKPEIYFAYGADFVVMGEGEETMVELLNAVNSSAPLENVRGISYLKERKIVKNGERQPMDVAHLPFPAFDLVNYEHYCNIRLGGIPGHFIRTGFLMANRGCPYRCRFCSDPIRSLYRERPLDAIISEIKWQIENWRIEGLVLLDDLFYFSDKRVTEFCERILKENLKLKLYAQGRVDRIGSSDTLKLMKKAGFIQLAIGVESGSQRMLDVMKKGTTVERTRDVIQRVNEAGIYSYAFLIIGFPEETVEDLELTARFLEKVKPTFVAVNHFMPMPGTQYYDETTEHGFDGLSFSLTENQERFYSSVPRDTIMSYRKAFFALAEKSADLNLLRYPSFYMWVAKLIFFRPIVILKGIYIQKKTKRYPSYFDAVRTSMINYRICGC